MLQPAPSDEELLRDCTVEITEDTQRIGDVDAFLSPDRDGDRVICTTERRIGRVAFLAASIGARSVTDDTLGDPMEWLIKPLEIFGGRCALDAAQELHAMIQGLLLHDLLLETDADPGDLRGLAPLAFPE